jgi:predicted dehydrogenase
MSILVVGTGFVADLYMRSLATFGVEASVLMAYDRDPARLSKFCEYWKVSKAESLEALLANAQGLLVLNLTNPKSHFDVSMAALKAGKHVYSEKPLALSMEHAKELHDFAKSKGLCLASAPCSILSEAAQTLWKAVRDGVIGKPRLVYAELDDNFIASSPFRKWMSETGAPWPFEDEFQVGCTFEHAGYYLTWLIAIFGSVKSVTAFSTNVVIKEKFPTIDGVAPDYSCASLLFESGVVARLTCSVVANHDHQIQIVGDEGVLKVDECWDNRAKVYFQKRYTIRRRLLNSPFKVRVRPSLKVNQPSVGRWGAASMNFALGPIEMLRAIREGRPSRMSSEFALHLNEVTLAIHEAGVDSSTKMMTTTCPAITPMEMSA